MRLKILENIGILATFSLAAYIFYANSSGPTEIELTSPQDYVPTPDMLAEGCEHGAYYKDCSGNGRNANGDFTSTSKPVRENDSKQQPGNTETNLTQGQSSGGFSYEPTPSEEEEYLKTLIENYKEGSDKQSLEQYLENIFQTDQGCDPKKYSKLTREFSAISDQLNLSENGNNSLAFASVFADKAIEFLDNPSADNPGAVNAISDVLLYGGNALNSTWTELYNDLSEPEQKKLLDIIGISDRNKKTDTLDGQELSLETVHTLLYSHYIYPEGDETGIDFEALENFMLEASPRYKEYLETTKKLGKVSELSIKKEIESYLPGGCYSPEYGLGTP